ncbi:AMP-binding protein [Lentzea sp. NPDC034063]|uniref:AMP-binding protein n=1 Tax=unclassified Lentzea TaxID=2643253 RepID=UPI0033CC4198
MTVRPSPHQIRLLVAQHVDPGSSALNHAVLLRPRSMAAAGALRTAVPSMAAAHDNLRYRFRRGGPDGWVAVDGPPAAAITNTVQLSETDLPHRTRCELDRPFDLSVEAPLRIAWWTGPWGHVCQLTFHHVATDARTLELLLDDLRSRCAEPKTAPGRPPSASYFDLAAETWRAANDVRRKQRLRDYAGEVGAVDLSPLLPVGPGRGVSATSVWQVPGDVADAARRVAIEVESTPFVVWLTAWSRAVATLLDRWELPISVPMSTRRSRTELGTAGFFVNSVVLPIQMIPDEPLVRSAARTRDLVLDGLERRDLPLHELASELDLEVRGLSNPLVAVSSQLLPVAMQAIELPASHIDLEYLESTEPRYQMSFEVRDDGRSQQGRVTVDARSLDTERLPVLQRLIEAELVPSRSRTSAVEAVAASKPCAAKAGPRSLVEPIEQWFRIHPGAPALEWNGGRWSRAELAIAVHEVVATMESAGIVPRGTVVVDVPRGPHFVAALLAVLSADMVPVMSRRTAGLDVDGELADQVGAVLKLAADNRGVVATARGCLRDPTTSESPLSEDTAYVTFTSGSTGRPKGVPAPLAGVLAYLDWVEVVTQLSTDDRCLQLASPGFDALVRDMIAPLRAGATLVLLPDEQRLSGPALHSAVLDGNISAILAMTPPQLRRLVSTMRGLQPVSHLRLVCVAGEPLFCSDLLGSERALPACRFFNLYGPTETTMTVTYLAVSESFSSHERLPVGRPIPGSTVHVVDSRGVEVPSGCTGEVVIAGPGVAGGYVGTHRPETSPFARRQVGGRLNWTYATGDRGYLLDDETGLRLLGRVDSEWKVNGERVNLEAIEAAIRSHPGVFDAVVHLDELGGLPLVVGTVAFHENPISLKELQCFLENKVPPAGIPRRLLIGPVARLLNGKIDRSVRPEPLVVSHVSEVEVAARRDVTEAIRQVLGSVPEDPTQSLFNFGLDSLQAIELLERLSLLSTGGAAATRFFDSPRMATLEELVGRSDREAKNATHGVGHLGLSWLTAEVDREAPAALVCFPHAGGDAPTFTPVATALAGRMNVAVARRPSPDDRPGTVAAWLDAYVHATTRQLGEIDGPVVLCGYSVGFIIACLAVRALEIERMQPVTGLVGINPSISGRDTVDLVAASAATPGVGSDASYSEFELARRLEADLALRQIVPVSSGVLPPVLLMQTPEDRRRFDADPNLLPRFAAVERLELYGEHVLTKYEMTRVGTFIRERADRWNET